MKEKEIKNLAPSAPQSSSTKVKELTHVQKLIRAFKASKGIDPDDTSWDRKFFTRHLRPANELLKAFDGDSSKAILYMNLKNQEWGSLSDWGLEGVINSAARDKRLYAGNDLFAPRIDPSAVTREFLKERDGF